MTEPTAAGAPGPETRCPWCSSVVPEAAEQCPSCGAALRATATEAADDIPGVTQVDPVVGLRRRLPRPNRLVGWLADVDIEPASTLEVVARGGAGVAGGEGLEAAGPGSVAPPSEAVKREMARLELEAIRAELEARAAEARATQASATQASAASPDGAEATTAPGADATAGADALPADEDGPRG